MKRCLLILVCLVPLLSASPADALPVLETGLLFPLGLHPEADVDPGGYGLYLPNQDQFVHVDLSPVAVVRGSGRRRGGGGSASLISSLGRARFAVLTIESEQEFPDWMTLDPDSLGYAVPSVIMHVGSQQPDLLLVPMARSGFPLYGGLASWNQGFLDGSPATRFERPISSPMPEPHAGALFAAGTLLVGGALRRRSL